MMKAVFLTLLLVGMSAAYALDVPTDYNELVRLIFGEPPSPKSNERSKRQANTDQCECVPYYQCNFNGTMNENGEGIIDIRTGFVGTEDNPVTPQQTCEHYLSVCCRLPEIIPGRDHEGQQHGGQNPGQGGNGQGGHEVQTEKPGQGGNEYPGQGGNEYPGQGGNEYPGQGGNEYPGEGGNHLPGQGTGVNGKDHVNKGCGYRNPNGVGFRITGAYNNEAQFAEFPWMVAILKQENIQGNQVKVYQCGGSLIHRRVVLTAAHCVHGKSPNQLSIRAGEWDTQTTDEPLLHQDRDVTIVVEHPGYAPNILFNDYALLILSQPVDLADNVEVVCLPEVNEYFDYSKCFATGWGKNEFGEKGHYQVILKAVELPVVPHDQCQASLRTTRLGKYFKLHDSFTCAGGVDGVDTCTGDGGSPLVCPLTSDPSRYTQAGIVAWGIGCGQDNIPGVYADVTKGRKWIDETLASYNIDSLSYTPYGNNFQG